MSDEVRHALKVIAERNSTGASIVEARITQLEETNQRLRKSNAEQIKAEFEARERVTALEALLRECADDLSSWIDQAYPKNTMHYPSQKRRYERDMELVRRVWKLLGMEDDRK